MVGNLVAVAGSKIFIGSRVAAKGIVTLADFAAQESQWTEIGGWTQSGSLGDTQELVTQNFINEGRTRQIKGTRVGGSMENTFAPLSGDPGQDKFRTAIDECTPRAFKVEWGAGCALEDVVTISVAAPGVVSWPDGHGLEPDSPLMFSVEGGNMPTGLTAGTAYYVKTVLSPTTFTVTATPGGAAIATTLAATGTVTAIAQQAGQTDLFYGLAMPGAKQGGEANTSILRTWAIAVDSNIVEI